MQITYTSRAETKATISGLEDESLDFIILVAGSLKYCGIDTLTECLTDCARVLRKGGLLFLQGTPEFLPRLGVSLDALLTFKYWIAIESAPECRTAGLPSVHAGVLLFSKGQARFNIKRIRFSHKRCSYCGKSLRDWGGKTHLMNPEGYAVSDVWTDLPIADNYIQMSQPLLDNLLRLIDFPKPAHEVCGLIGPSEGINTVPIKVDERPAQELTLALNEDRSSYIRGNSIPPDLVNVILRGDALRELRRYPDDCIDLAFADPPYNLNKGYNVYEDGWSDQEYIDWCNSWLAEYARILKPNGSLYVLNLPRWSMHHATFLNEHLSFQNWIVWDALSEPRGKLMPAHYALLFYTKHPTDFTLNLSEVRDLDARSYCLRANCMRKRKLSGVDRKEHLTDIWWDVHRIKHKRDRDYHPCQLPESLLERIIRLSSNEGDIVLDALCGVGTTPVVAAKLNRRYVGIDLDESYVSITQQKLQNIETLGYVARNSVRKTREAYSKKELQLELRALAARLGRLPSPEDVQRMSGYGIHVYNAMFPTWGKALKAAKLEVGNDKGA